MIEEASPAFWNTLKIFGKQTGHPAAPSPVMELGMSVITLAGQHDQIGWVIIKAIAIPVVHYLSGA